MKTKSKLIRIAHFVVFVLVLSVSNQNIHAQPGPIKNNGNKWRIGYYEGGPWRDYQASLVATIKSLMKHGWIEKAPMPRMVNQNDTKKLWEWLAVESKSDFLEFPENAYWSADWDKQIRKENKQRCINALQSKAVDLMFAMGTWAGKDLANNLHSVPTIVMSTTDAIGAGIIKSAEDSGFDHVLAKYDPTRYERQFRLFHDIFHFNNVGIIYEDSKEGRIFSHLKAVKKIAAERKFNIVECQACDNNMCPGQKEKIRNAYLKCIKEIAPKIDAIIYSDHTGANPENLKECNKILFEYKIPSWSPRGVQLVEYGALMSIARADFSDLGIFYTKKISQIFHGKKPRSLNQVHKEIFKLAINTETARKIGYKIPSNLLKAK